MRRKEDMNHSSMHCERMRMGSQQLMVLGVYRALFSTAHPVTVSKFLDEFLEFYSTWPVHYF